MELRLNNPSGRYIGTKLPVLIKETHVIFFEYAVLDDVSVIFAHIDIKKWNKTTKHEVERDIYHLAVIQAMPILVLHDELDLKHYKFITQNGFVNTNIQVTTEAGEIRFFYVWKDRNYGESSK